jgi:hypothetical protein
MSIDVQVIEMHDEDGVEWGISFDGPNPNEEDYFEMMDGESAFRLKYRIMAECSKREK